MSVCVVEDLLCFVPTKNNKTNPNHEEHKAQDIKSQKITMMMSRTVSLVYATLIVMLSTHVVAAYNTSSSSSSLRGPVESSQRRSLLSGAMLLSAAAGAAVFPAHRAVAAATDNTNMIDVYFGVGCYWHIQHEFVVAERTLLQRGDHDLTSRTGYAGGTKLGSEGRVCYHNYQGMADYGKLGHAEVVGMSIPQDKLADFAKVYFNLFDPATGERVDPQDKGPEYRSLIGLPGGIKHPLYETAVAAVGTAMGFTLVSGKGNEPDTLGKNKLVNVYDTNTFPFHQAEVYMQFKDDFQSAPYGKEYNNLVELALEDGRVIGQGCPDTY